MVVRSVNIISADSAPVDEDSQLEGFDDLFASVKAELNFLRLPYFVTKKEAHKAVLELIETAERNGIKRQIQWKVIVDPRVGLPGALERNLMFFILKCADELRPSVSGPIPERINIGSLYSICQTLGIPDDGRNIKRIKNAIEKLGTTQCISKGAFYNKASNEYEESGKVFSFLQEWGFRGENRNGSILETNYVVFHPLVRSNLDTFYVKTLDWHLLRSLHTEIAALIYPHLSCIFHGKRKDQDFIEINYTWLAQRIGIKVWDSLREAKKQLKPAHQELIKNGYLADAQWYQDKIRYFPGIRASVEIARQNKRRRSSMPRNTQQLVIPMLAVLKETSDARATEIAFQVARLQRGLPLKQERLIERNIDPQEVYAHLTALGKTNDSN